MDADKLLELRAAVLQAEKLLRDTADEFPERGSGQLDYQAERLVKMANQLRDEAYRLANNAITAAGKAALEGRL